MMSALLRRSARAGCQWLAASSAAAKPATAVASTAWQAAAASGSTGSAQARCMASWSAPRSGSMLQPSSTLLTATPAGVRTMFISVEDTPNPDSLKFLPGREVLAEEFGTGQQYYSKEDAKGCFLARRLLRLDGITSVFLARDFISVNKNGSAEWIQLKPKIFEAIMDAYGKSKSLVEFVGGEDPHGITEDDDEIVSLIKYLLEDKIRPYFQEDGGDVFFESFEDGVVYLRMAGSCVGCPSSTESLKSGVEQMLRHYIPEVDSVEPVEDDPLKQLNMDEVKSLEERLAAAGVPQN